VQKTHHALVDGVSGVDVATVLLDFDPEAPIGVAPDWTPVPAPSHPRLLADTMVERATERTEVVRTARGLLRTPQRTAEQAARLGHALRSLAAAVPIAPRTSLHGAVGRRRTFVGARVRLDEVKEVRQQLGGTVNDVVLACVAGALRRRLLARGEGVPDRLRVVCPVSIRTADQHQQLGNHLSAMFVDLPLGDPDPVTRLATIRAATAHLKDEEQALGAAFVLDMTRYAAPTMLGLTARLVHRQPFVNLVVTNVPGPQAPLFCMGARMLEAFPLVPLSRNLGLGIAILSYCGVLHFGLWADADLHPDLTDLGREVEAAFTELRQAGASPLERGAVG
jgi:WS/DGAT/MGAT family acyltransferase